MRTITMGRYIDSLTDEQRDRLIEATDFSDGEWWDGKCGCLVGTAEDLVGGLLGVESYWLGRYMARPPGVGWVGCDAPYRYPEAIRRFGKKRVVRAIKLRAAAAMSCEVERAAEAVGVGG